MVKVLIVDDEYIMRQGLKYMIDWEKEGFEIVGEAANGLEALSLIQKENPHIVICDIVMPMMDGVDFSMMIHRMYPDIQIIILSGYDNFEYVKQTLMNGAMDYILKPTLNQEELKTINHKAAEKIPGNLLEDYSGYISYDHVLERYILGHDKELDTSLFQECFTGSEYCLFALKTRDSGSDRQNLSNILYKKIERELKEDKLFQKRLLFLREEVICAVFSLHSFQHNKLHEFLEGLSEQLSYICPDLFCICSRFFQDLKDINVVYAQDVSANLERAFYYQNRKLLILNGQETAADQSAKLKFDFFRYNYHLDNGQFRNALHILEDYNENGLQLQVDIYRLKNQTKNMIYYYLDCLKTDDKKKEDCWYSILKEINEAEYETAYRECLKNIWQKLIELSDTVASPNDERMVKILEYIDQNFNEDLSLEKLAVRFNFNYHYLSSIFSQQMKEGFSEYLNRIRISRACELLKDTRYSIAEISEMVGYSEHSYFSRVFRKITGKTPSVWRRRQENEK